VDESDDSRSLFLFDAINQGISDDCAIIVASESNPDEIIKELERKGVDAKHYINRGILTILDREFVYSVAQTGLEAEELLKRWFSLISDVKKKSGRDRVLAIGTTRVFLDTHNLDKLMVYEHQIGREFNVPLEAVCCFDAKAFSKLGFTNMIHFLDYHEGAIHHGGVYVHWNGHMILTMINRAIDNALGEGTSQLMLKTLELVYHIDKEKIISEPELFEEKIQKLFGKSAEKVFNEIKKEITKQLLYLPKHDDTDRRLDE
jgi:hypothetical protein